jgi:hypothetical protein
LHLPHDITNKDRYNLLTSIFYIFNDISFKNIHVNNFIAKLEAELPEKDWRQVNDSFYSQTPYLAAPLMCHFQQSHATELLYKACKGTFESLIAYGLDDYENLSVAPSLPGYHKDPKYSYVPGNDPGIERSAKLFATLFLIKGLRENREQAEPTVKALIANPKMIQKFPKTVAALKRALQPRKSG